MTGGLIQIVSFGNQDIMLNGNPEITFFTTIYRRYTNFGKNFICKDKNLDNVFMDSKILINLDFQTSFYQSMVSGKPVIIFTSREFTHTINHKIKKLFEEFRESKIVITKVSDLIQHIENIWSEPYEWWNSDKIVSLRNKFNELCAKKSNDKLSDIILSQKKKYEKND